MSLVMQGMIIIYTNVSQNKLFQLSKKWIKMKSQSKIPMTYYSPISAAKTIDNCMVKMLTKYHKKGVYWQHFIHGLTG
jgi:hypothetical protein